MTDSLPLQTQEFFSRNFSEDNLHLCEAMKSDDRENFMKAMEKINKIFDHRIILRNDSKSIASKSSTHNPINIELQEEKENHLDR